MQNALSVLLTTVEGLLAESEIEKSLEVLFEIDKQSGAEIKNDIILLSGRFNTAKKMYQQGVLDERELERRYTQISHSLLELMKSIPKKIELNAKVRSISTYQFRVPDEANLEKIIGSQNNLLKISWLEHALKASKAVCRVVCADGSLGTGFITKEGYLFTNNHVIGSAETAKTARIEFNYELDPAGKVKKRTAYQLDAKDFVSSTPDKFDFARVKIIDRADAPLRDWGYVEFDPDAIPTVGESVTIIQHPKGEDKQIALNANEVLGQMKQHLFYTTDTEPGSSGSPVFNRDWKVVAIHHAGKTDAEGGLVINAKGERRGANRGILFRDIFAMIGGARDAGGPPASGESGGKESMAAPRAANPPKPAPASKIPKFVVVYDLADDAFCKTLNKHLNVLKITKKIRVYNVHEAVGGENPMERAQQELADADYMLVIITVNLFNSDWFGVVYESLETGRRIIPLRLSNADLDGTGLEKLKSLPSLNRMVSDFPNPDAAFMDIVAELKKLLPA